MICRIKRSSRNIDLPRSSAEEVEVTGHRRQQGSSIIQGRQEEGSSRTYAPSPYKSGDITQFQTVRVRSEGRNDAMCAGLIFRSFSIYSFGVLYIVSYISCQPSVLYISYSGTISRFKPCPFPNCSSFHTTEYPPRTKKGMFVLSGFQAFGTN